jgi:uncharacterized protein (UPF0254 family)
MTLSKASSFNNKLILESYKHTEIRPEGNKGWITAGQKNSLKGLRVLLDAELPNGDKILAGSKAWVKEDSLHTAVWAKDIRKCDFIPGEFILVTMNEVEFISPPEGGAA